MNTVLAKLGQYWKAITAGAGSVLLAWNSIAPGLSGILPESWQAPIAVVVALVTAVATYSVPGPEPKPAPSVPPAGSA
jgi:hypothetical protein